MIELITKEQIIELKPSGVLRSMIRGLQTHDALPDCAIDLGTFGAIDPEYTMRPGGKKYQLCAATSTLMDIAGTTFPEWVQYMLNADDLYEPTQYWTTGHLKRLEYWPSYLTNLKYALDETRTHSISLLRYFDNIGGLPPVKLPRMQGDFATIWEIASESPKFEIFVGSPWRERLHLVANRAEYYESIGI